jgi:eukaryotic-like serine/threonine-protein kinase
LGIDGMMRGWHIDRAPRSILGRHERSLYPVVVSPDGQTIASGSWDGTLRLWSTATGEERLRIHLADAEGATSAALAAEFTPDGRTLVVAAGVYEWVGTRLLAYDPHDGSLLADLGAGDGYVAMARDVAGGRVIVANTAGVLAVRQENRERQPIRTMMSGMMCAAWSSPQRSVLCFAGPVGFITVLSEGAGAGEKVLPCGEIVVHGGAISPDGRQVAAGGLDGTLQVWNLQTSTLLAKRRVHDGPIFAVAYSPDGSRLATGGRDRAIFVWDTSDYEQILRLDGHEDYVYSLAWSADGRTLYSGSGDGTIRIWAGDGRD